MIIKTNYNNGVLFLEYAKDDVWMVCTSAKMPMGAMTQGSRPGVWTKKRPHSDTEERCALDTVCMFKSVFHGPSSRNMIELKPLLPWETYVSICAIFVFFVVCFFSETNGFKCGLFEAGSFATFVLLFSLRNHPKCDDQCALLVVYISEPVHEFIPVAQPTT